MLSKHYIPSTATAFATNRSFATVLNERIVESGKDANCLQSKLHKQHQQLQQLRPKQFFNVAGNSILTTTTTTITQSSSNPTVQKQNQKQHQQQQQQQQQNFIKTMTKQLSIDNAAVSTTNNKTTATTDISATDDGVTLPKQLMEETYENSSSLTTFRHNSCTPCIISPTAEASTFEAKRNPLNALSSQQSTSMKTTNSTTTATTTATDNHIYTDGVMSQAMATEAAVTLTTSTTTISTREAKTSSTTIITTAPTLLTPTTYPYASSSNDANGRSAALERAYVHDVYENCEESSGSLKPRVVQFLSNLEPGSIVCDVGCGSGRYLTQCNSNIYTIGVDRCQRLSRAAKVKGGEITLCDNLELPFRNESFDAVLSLAVIHHFATTDRRINAIRELARILRVGGRVVITVWAMEQKNQRFESQDVLVPWQPSKIPNVNNSDDEEEDDYLAPYHVYTEDSNSSRSTGEGDSSSLSSSSPGESCYSFVRRAIKKLAGNRKHAWFLESWTSKDTQKNGSFDCEDAKDLPIELRHLEDFKEPPLLTTLKSRSLSSILNPQESEVVRSRSSIPSLGDPLTHYNCANQTKAPSSTSTSIITTSTFPNSIKYASATTTIANIFSTSQTALTTTTGNTNRRPKLIKQKQSLCDEDFELPHNSFHMLSKYNSKTNGLTTTLYTNNESSNAASHHSNPNPLLTSKTSALLSRKMRKQSSLNEELMAGNRLREKERLRKRIQKQHSLNEAFLCRSAMLSKRLQVIREGFTNKIKNSSDSLERVTKSSFTKILQNLKTTNEEKTDTTTNTSATQETCVQQCTHEHHHHHHHHHSSNQLPMQAEYHILPPQQQQQRQAQFPFVTNFQNHFKNLLHKQTQIVGISTSNKYAGPVTICRGVNCSTTACYCATYHQGCTQCSMTSGNEEKSRRQSRESGSDSSKDNSLQSDTSIESEDSFASVIYIPKPEQHQQQLNYQTQHQNSNSSSSNSSSSNGTKGAASGTNCSTHCDHNKDNKNGGSLITQGPCCKIEYLSSLPTSPLIKPCPPTPAHSPAAVQTVITSPPQIVSAVSAAMAILTPFPSQVSPQSDNLTKNLINGLNKTHFNFDETHIKEQKNKELKQVGIAERNNQEREEIQLSIQISVNNTTEDPCTEPKKDLIYKKNVSHQVKGMQHNNSESNKEVQSQSVPGAPVLNRITQQTIKDLPPIPKFRRQQTMQLCRQGFPIVRRSSSGRGAVIASFPKLLSLEIYNPATDDLDSDSSEASSPDSIDSVISTSKSNAPNETTNDHSPPEHEENEAKTKIETESNLPVDKEDTSKYKETDTPTPGNILIFNKDDHNDITPKIYEKGIKEQAQDCTEFVELVSAHLKRREESDRKSDDIANLENVNEDLDDPFSNQRRKYSEHDLIAIRDELRERRLMLANLSIHASLNQSPTSSSTSSLSSQARSFTIHEEDENDDEEENERSYSLQLYENYKMSKLNFYHNPNYNLHPETAHLLQDENSSIKDDDDDDVEQDIIVEKGGVQKEQKNLSKNNKERIEEYSPKNEYKSLNCDFIKAKEEQLQGHDNERKGENTVETALTNQQSTESWERSSSTASLESPNQGGATTHHRYYHVFREGELEALINYHVSNLHIVSSYYERSSWCVVAEKVNVWTI